MKTTQYLKRLGNSIHKELELLEGIIGSDIGAGTDQQHSNQVVDDSRDEGDN
jgi:hypothetical protein